MKKHLLVLCVPFFLLGCTTPKPINYGKEDISYKYEDLENTIQDYEPIDGVECSLGGWFIEVGGGRFLVENSEYDFVFTYSGSGDTRFRVVSSHKDHIETGFEDDHYFTTNKFTLKTKTPGDSLIRIYNAEGMLCYRRVIKVRPERDSDEVLQLATEADNYSTLPSYTNWLGSWKLTVLNSLTGESVLSGTDEMEMAPIRMTFTLDYKGYSQDQDWHSFRTVDVQGYTKDTYVTYINFTRAGDLAYIYYASGPQGKEEHLLSISYNSELKDLYMPTKK